VDVELRREVVVGKLHGGEKQPRVASGAPFPPALEHSDGPADRPRRDVPTSDIAGQEPADNRTELEEEEDA
jgi:hypothetical protein